MPIYEFRCATCGHRFEKLCAMGETGENMNCPHCNTPHPKRVLSTFSAAGTGTGIDDGSNRVSGCGTCSSSSCSSCRH